MRYKSLPGQLPLELDWSLMKWVDSTGEAFESYEKSTASLYRSSGRSLLPRSPLMEEIILRNNG